MTPWQRAPDLVRSACSEGWCWGSANGVYIQPAQARAHFGALDAVVNLADVGNGGPKLASQLRAAATREATPPPSDDGSWSCVEDDEWSCVDADSVIADRL